MDPLLFKRIAEASKVSQDYQEIVCVLFFSMLAVGLCFFSKEALLLTDKSFHEAVDIVPIIVIAYLWNGLYIIPLNF